MKKNVGHPLDKTARIIVGVILVSLVFSLEGAVRWLGLVGVVPIVTVFVGWCPIWEILGINTSKSGDSEHPHPV